MSGRYLLDEAITAASYRHGETSVASISAATTVEELRADNSYRVGTIDESTEVVRAGPILPLLPLAGGSRRTSGAPTSEAAADAAAGLEPGYLKGATPMTVPHRVFVCSSGGVGSNA